MRSNERANSALLRVMGTKNMLNSLQFTVVEPCREPGNKARDPELDAAAGISSV
jgi:hypothetical protein